MKVGITEAGDAGLDFSWVDKLFDVNIIITKHLTPNNQKLISSLIDNKDKIILHCTCTGYGKTIIEPNVPAPIDVYNGIIELINRGFPVENIVLRTDPIIPTEKGIANVEKIWGLFSSTGIKRCRYSVIDLYPHVVERFFDKIGKVPFEGYSAPESMINSLKRSIEQHNGLYEFESCAEKLPKQIGCISKKDFDILGVKFDNQDGGFQRKGCLCVAGKTELLKNKKRCPSNCLYCYWKD